MKVRKIICKNKVLLYIEKELKVIYKNIKLYLKCK